ncbi:MAG: hypothetical protein HYR91_03995 [Flavobacteriia bacterium]|nr:hypothetical protein [Flavobacteriia bacterium]
MQKCFILGLGWLGLPLAKKLLKKGFIVSGTTTSKVKKEEIEANSRINTHVWSFQNPIHFLDDLLNSDLVIIAIPASKSIENIQHLLDILQNLQPKSDLIFLSSTSVYPDNLVNCMEDYSFTNEDLKNKNVQLEIAITQNIKNKITILRLAGLIGPNRHPIKQLNGKINIPDGLSPVNLVHLDDVINAINQIVSKKLFGHIYNICYPSHPSRLEYYTRAAELSNLPQPHFQNTNTKTKQINSKKSVEILKFEYMLDINSYILK